MDGGIDDALALIVGLAAPEIEVVGITAVSGNVPVEQATKNALRIVELLNRPQVWVAQGLAKPMVRDPIRAFSFHGKDGLGDSNLPDPKLRPLEKPAMQAFTETLSNYEKRAISIICTGPLTNMASLLTGFPDAIEKVEEVVIMGGAFGLTKYGIGNETPVAEFNIYSDPEAAKLVFESGVRIKAVGLDVTTIPRLELNMRDYGLIGKGRRRGAAFASRILENNMRAHGRFTLHDPMVVAVKIRPNFYRFEEHRVNIETKGEYTTGMTVADRRNRSTDDRLAGKPAEVCSAVDLRFKRFFIKRLIDA